MDCVARTHYHNQLKSMGYGGDTQQTNETTVQTGQILFRIQNLQKPFKKNPKTS